MSIMKNSQYTAQKKFAAMMRPYTARVRFEAALRAAILGLLAAGAAGIIAVILSHFLPVGMKIPALLLISAGIGLASGIAFYFLSRPTLRDAAMRLDGSGFDNRAETCLDLIGDDSVFALLQRRDTEEKIRAFRPSGIKLKINAKQAAAALLVLAMLAGSCFIPNANQTAISARAAEKEREDERIDAAVEKLEETVEKSDLSPENKQKAEKLIEGLKEKLKEADGLSEKMALVNERRRGAEGERKLRCLGIRRGGGLAGSGQDRRGCRQAEGRS